MNNPTLWLIFAFWAIGLLIFSAFDKKNEDRNPPNEWAFLARSAFWFLVVMGRGK